MTAARFKRGGAADLASVIHPEKRCPMCGSAMFIKKPCGSMKRAGFKTALRCLKAGCPHQEGYERLSPHQGVEGVT